ncbi:ShlB/FhaC/HecB family hemolysin secretion/activation protein [Pseudomonas wadenswilerensis]
MPAGDRRRPRCLAALGALALAVGMAAANAEEAPVEAQRKVDIAEYVVRGNSVLDARAIEEAVYPFLGPGRTMQDIEGARDALQEAYQSRGYQSVYVELPEQQVADGVVYLQVSETKVGRVRVVGAKHYSPKDVRDEVPALAEGAVPNFEQVQSQLADLNRTPGRQVVPLVREGQRPGTMDVDLKVEDKKPWHVNLGLNNDHSADTKDLRSVVSIGHDNLWQAGHQASLTWFTAPQKRDDAEVWSGSYTVPLSERWSVQASGYKSDSDVATVGGTNVVGRGHSYGLALTYSLPPSASWSHALSLGVDFKDFEERVVLGGSEDRVPLKYAPLTFSYTGFHFTESAQTSLGLSLVAGTRSFLGYGSDDEDFAYKRYLADSSFGVLKGDLNHTRIFSGDWQAGAKAAFQLASGPLVSNEQFSAGGATSVRGYLAAEATGDDGAALSLEARTPSLSGWLGKGASEYLEEWRFYLFADGAHLRVQDTQAEQQDDFTLASVGIGTRMRLGEWLSGSVDWALPLRDGPNTEKHDSRVHFSVQANF